MSVQVANIDLSLAVVGTKGTINFGQAVPPPTLAQQMRPQSASGYRLFIHNESACGLTCTFPITNKQFTIRAGDQRMIYIPPGDVQLNFTVAYVLSNPAVSALLADLYIPGEDMDGMGSLGNSPLNGGNVATATTQVIQDGQPRGQTLVESTPTASAQTVLITTDGAAMFAGLLTLKANVLQENGTAQPPYDQISDQANNSQMRWDLFNEVARLVTAYRGAGGVVPISVNLSNEAVTIEKNVASLGGQATAGPFGVPVIVAQALNVLVTATTLQSIVSFTPPVDGLYRCSLYFTFSNTSATTITAGARFADPNAGGPLANFVQGNTVLQAASFGAGTLSVPTSAITIYAKAANAITIQFTDSAGVPNDHVSAMIERLS